MALQLHVIAYVLTVFSFSVIATIGSTEIISTTVDLTVYNLRNQRPIVKVSADFIQHGCGSLYNASHLIVSNSLSACENNSPIPQPTSQPSWEAEGYQWALVVSGDDGDCSMTTKFRNAVKQGYSSVIVGTDKLSEAIVEQLENDVVLDGVDIVDGLLVSPYDLKILSKYAHPNYPNYLEIVITNPSRQESPEKSCYCEKERRKPFTERNFHNRYTIKRFKHQISVQQSITHYQEHPVNCLACNNKARIETKLETLRTTAHDFLAQHFKCQICNEILQDGVKTHCKHLFCSNCLQKWTNDQNNLCPVCRVSFHLSAEPESINMNELMNFLVNESSS